MNKILATIGVLLITVLAALFAGPALIDWSRYRSTFESEASRLLGRHVRVGDQVQLRLLPTPYISFDNVRVADATGRFDTPILRMESFRMQLSTSALLTGNLVAQDVELKAPTFRLAVGRDGKGNWDGLLPPVNASTRAGSSGSFSISTVHISHGSVEAVGASEGQQWRLEDVSGDIDAAGPQGPFRFKGTYQQNGKAADLRLSVGRDDVAGKLRLKASTHGADVSAASYTFDGSVETRDGQTTLAGDLDGNFPFPAVAAALSPAPAGGFEFKSKLVANSEQAKFDEIEIAIDGAGRPQRLTGSAAVGLNPDAESQATVKSTWIDLDYLARAAVPASATEKPAKATPRDSVQGLFALAGSWPGTAGKGRIQLTIDEAVFGGGAVYALNVLANRNPNGVTIESLTARLPGQSLFSVSGEVNTLGATHFDGQVRLWGTNLATMANWAEPALRMKETSGASPYLIDTELAVDAARFSAEKLRAEVSGTTVTGAIRYVGSPQSLSIILDSNRLDLAQVIDSPVNLAGLVGLAGAPADPAAAPGSGIDLKSLLAGDTFLDLRIGHLLTAQGALHDVSAKLNRSNGRLNIPGIDVATDNGFALHVEGALQVKDDQGQGQLRMLVGVPSPEAAMNALKIAGFADDLAAAQQPLAALTPLNLAGTVELGGKSSAGETLALDGSAAGSRLRLLLRRDSGDTDWQSGQLDAAADLSNPDAEKLLEQIARGLGRSLSSGQAAASVTAAVGPQAATPSAPPGTLLLRLSGIPEDGLATRIGLATGVLDATFDGRTSYGAERELTADGSLAIAAKDANRAVRLAGLTGLVADQTGELKLAGKLHRDAAALALTEVSLAVAGVRSTGDARLVAGSPRPAFEAHVQSASLALDRWLGLLTSAASANAPAPTDIAESGQWPDKTFDFGVTQVVDAKITASAKQVVMIGGFNLEDAHVTAETAPGKLNLAVSAGRALQGDWSGRLSLEKAPAGATVHIDAALEKARLDQLGGPRGALPHPEGELAFHVGLDGRGLTPRDIVGALAGKGAFSLSEGAFAGFSSNTVDAVARISLADSAPVSADSLTRRLSEASKTGAFAFQGAKGNLTVSDGAARFDKLLVDSAQSQLEITNRVDLTRLQLASTWRLQPKPVQAGKPSLPAVQFVYQGALSDLGHIQPAVESSDLKSDLDGRKLLGEPEQSQGIWPADGSVAQGPEADSTPPVAAPLPAAAGLKQADATIIAKPDVAPIASAAAAEVLPAAGPAIGNPTATAAAAQANTGPASDATTKRTPPRPRKKKIGWAASFLQGLFGN